MSRELPDYRANLEQLNKRFPDKEMLRMKDVAQVFGVTRYDALHKMVPFRKIGGRLFISKAALARVMSGGDL